MICSGSRGRSGTAGSLRRAASCRSTAVRCFRSTGRSTSGSRSRTAWFGVTALVAGRRFAQINLRQIEPGQARLRQIKLRQANLRQSQLRKFERRAAAISGRRRNAQSNQSGQGQYRRKQFLHVSLRGIKGNEQRVTRLPSRGTSESRPLFQLRQTYNTNRFLHEICVSERAESLETRRTKRPRKSFPL